MAIVILSYVPSWLVLFQDFKTESAFPLFDIILSFWTCLQFVQTIIKFQHEKPSSDLKSLNGQYHCISMKNVIKNCWQNLTLCINLKPKLYTWHNKSRAHYHNIRVCIWVARIEEGWSHVQHNDVAESQWKMTPFAAALSNSFLWSTTTFDPSSGSNVLILVCFWIVIT